MISSIIDNLCVTFRSSGENVNEQIRESEEALLNLTQQAEFYPSLFQIISSNEIPNEIRKASINYLRYLIRGWSTLLNDEARIFIIENFPSLLMHSLPFLGMNLKLSENLVDCTFYADNSWPNLFDVILTGFLEFETGKEKTFSSIILLNSISRRFKKRYDIEPNPIINNFYPFLRDFIFFSIKYHSEKNETNLNFLPFAAICYQTINFFNSSHLSQYFIENVEDFNELLLQTTQIACYKKMNFTTEEEFIYFSKQAMKFSAKMIKKYPKQIKDTVSIQILQSLFEFFSKFHNNELILSSVARLINSFIFYEPTYHYILENECSNFIIKLIFPFFYLNVQDIEDSKNDPSQFLAKFQTQNYFYESESRGFLHQTIVQKTKEIYENKEKEENQQFIITIFQIFIKVIEKYINEENSENFEGHQEKDDALIYSIFNLFSMIYPSIPYLNNEAFLQLIELFSRLFESPSHLVLSGVLFGLKSISMSFSLSCSSSNVYFPPQFYTQTAILLISHPSQLVRYSAANAFYEIIRIAYRSDYPNQESSQGKIILEECSKFLPDILKSFFEISIDFNDFEFIELLINIMTIFSSSLMSDASQLICQVFEMFININPGESNLSLPYLGGNIIDALFKFIKEIFVRNQQVSIESIIEPLLECILQVLTSSNLYHAQTYRTIFEFIAKLSFISTFKFSNENCNSTLESIFSSEFAFQFEKRNRSGPFPPIFWKLFEIIPQIIELNESDLIEDGIYAMRSIFICNSETGLNEEILSFTFQLLCDKYMNKFCNELNDGLNATMLFLSTIFVISPPNSLLNIDEMFKNLIFALKTFFQHYDVWIYSSILFISMLIQNSSVVFNILKMNESLMSDENFIATFCLEWFEITSDSYLQMFFILNFHQLFNHDVISVFIQKTLINFRKNYESFDFDDSDQKIDLFFSPRLEKKAPICSLILLNSNRILESFTQFMCQNEADYPELAGKFKEIMQIRDNYFIDENAIDENLADIVFEEDMDY